jgi:hypothetical protein
MGKTVTKISLTSEAYQGLAQYCTSLGYTKHYAGQAVPDISALLEGIGTGSLTVKAAAVPHASKKGKEDF